MVEEKVILTSKEAIIEFNDLPLEEIYVKEWKASVYLKPINVEERIKWENSLKPEDPSFSVLNLLIYSICDDKGNLLFSESDIPTLRGKNASVIVRLFRRAQKLSKIREKDIEEEIKNSESIRQD
jgi:hypothetical protein